MKTAPYKTAIALALGVLWPISATSQTPSTCVLNEEHFTALDVDRDGKLSELEFKACADATAADTQQAIEDQFAAMDRDRDTAISKTEAQQYVAEAPLDAGSPPADKADAAPMSGALGTGTPPSGASSAAPVAPPAPLALAPAAEPAKPPVVDTLRWQTLVGAEVTNLAGETVGEFSKIVVGPANEHAAVIESGGFLGIGAREYVIPLQQLQVQDDKVLLNMPKNEVEQLPRYQKNEWTDVGK